MLKILRLTENAELLTETVRFQTYFFPSERRRSLRREKRSHARGKDSGKAELYPREEKKARRGNWREDMVHLPGKPFYAVKQRNTGYFASSREKAEQISSEAGKHVLPGYLASHFTPSGRTSLLINGRTKEISYADAPAYPPRAEQMTSGSLLCGDRAEGSVLSRRVRRTL